MFKSVVAAGHRRVAEIAAEMLDAGGNAFDAAIAAGFAAAVAEPALTSLGGGGFLLARTATGKARLFDFFVDTPGRGRRGPATPHLLPVTVRFPGSDQVFQAGLGSVAVPGVLKGFLHVQRELGRLPLAEVVSPAVVLARHGIELNGWQAYILGLLEPIMTLRPDGKALYQPAGSYVVEGDRLTNGELADFLESLASGGEREVYEGGLARRIARDMADGDGLLTDADLAAYRVIEREPLVASYRGMRLLTNPPPSFGGSLLAMSLELLEACELASGAFGAAPHLGALVAAMQEVDRQRALGAVGPADLSEAALAEGRERVRTASGGTTHVSVCDADGNVASMSMSNGEGSGYLIPGTGIMLNNMMGEDDLHPDGFHASPPGQRVASMMSPSVLLDGDDVRLVLGSGGSKRIRTALLQVMSNVVDFDLDVVAAVAAPRLHWDGDRVQAEPGFDDGALAALEGWWPLNRWSVEDVYFGGVHAVAPSGQGAGDPRRGGHAIVL